MPLNADDYVKSWLTKLKADVDTGKNCPMYATDDALEHYHFNHHNHENPLTDMFKLPVPWKKKDDVTPHLQKFDDKICLERESQDVRIGCPHACLCKRVIEDNEYDDNEPPFPGSKPAHCPKAEIKDLCSCKQVVMKEDEPCPTPPLTNPILLSTIDHTACTCPRVPLPLIKPEPKLQKPVQCECAERAKQKAPTFYKCMQERREVNIAQLFSQKDEPKSMHSFTVAVATQVELDQEDEVKEAFPKIPSITDFSEKSKKSKSSGKKSIISELTKTKTRKTQSDYTVSTARTGKTSLKETSCKDTAPCSKQNELSSEQSTTSTQIKETPVKKPISKTFSEQESEKVNKSCSTDPYPGRLKRKKFTSNVRVNNKSSDFISRSAKTGIFEMSSSSISSRTSKTSRSYQDKKRQNACVTYFMEGQSVSTSSDDIGKRRPKYVDVNDINKVKRKEAVEPADDACEFKFDTEENMKQIKEIIEKETQDCKTRLKLAYVDGMYPGFHVGHKTCCVPYMYVPKNMSWLYNTCEGAGKIKPDLGWRPGSIRADVASIMAIVKKGKPQPEFSSPPGGGIRRVDTGGTVPKKDKVDKEEKSEELDGEGYACLAEIDVYKKRAIDDGQQLATVIEDEVEEEKPRDMKPTLHMHKTHGQYFVTLHPAGKSKEVLESGQQDNVMLTFDRKALDSNADSDDWDDDDTTTVTEDSMEMDFTSALGMYKRRDPIPMQTVQTITQKIK